MFVLFILSIIVFAIGLIVLLKDRKLGAILIIASGFLFVASIIVSGGIQEFLDLLVSNFFTAVNTIKRWLTNLFEKVKVEAELLWIYMSRWIERILRSV